ncbi:MAG TPA: hypothetical protein VNU71_19400 [Burkholderiaceae bacterium]|nr:hypothetical protein [Burkholderiaceae bacterium]
MRVILPILICTALAAPAFAKLPAPSDEAKAKAAETAAKAAWTDKVGAYQLCQAMTRVADQYHKAQKDAPPALDTPPCADPGPFVAAPPAASAPLEAAGAHSPATMATSPPNSKTPAAEQAPAKK